MGSSWVLGYFDISLLRYFESQVADWVFRELRLILVS